METGLLLLAGGLAAGAFGSLLGLGGGLLIVPLLTIGFGLPVREAVGVSLVCVIVTSSASAGVFLERRQADLRLGMTLELFTALGAVVGGIVAFLLDERFLAGLFAVVLLYVASSMIRGSRPRPATEEPSDDRAYRTRNLGAGTAGSVVAGILSALLGIGGGLVKVPLMHLVMGVPLRVATSTSNLMIGITASASAVVYLLRGGIDANAAGPTAIGVFLGASLGSRIGHRLDVRVLRLLFVAVLLFTAYEMARRAVGWT
ncbi:MAG TPA: sulfite exporter TauE/SafE family protein [Candidatus Deferrimicrobiaceae bacterium]|nr:sulfite exporter TauE/SafE family protein [Candidatus Deferrimicrobiaceae bacterium]